MDLELPPQELGPDIRPGNQDPASFVAWEKKKKIKRKKGGVQYQGIKNNKIRKIKNMLGGFPGGAVVESLPANAGDTGSSPGLGRSHMPRSGWARGPQLLSLRVWSLCSASREATTVRDPCTAMRSGPTRRN